jgi:hypothetical protein
MKPKLELQSFHPIAELAIVLLVIVLVCICVYSEKKPMSKPTSYPTFWVAELSPDQGQHPGTAVVPKITHVVKVTHRYGKSHFLAACENIVDAYKIRDALSAMYSTEESDKPLDSQ